MKNHETGSSGPVVGSIKQPLKVRIKNKRIILVLVVCLAIGGYTLYNHSTKPTTDPTTVISEARKDLSEQKYNDAYKLLKSNKDNEAVTSNVSYYVLISRSALAINKKTEALEYAKKGADLYNNSPVKNAEDGYALQSILTGTFTEKPAPNNMDNTQPVPVEKSNKPDFQG